jgi:lysozyme
MKLSRAGLDFIKQAEGFRSRAYQDSAGVWTIGYGHTGNVRPGDVVTEAEALDLLAKDAAASEAAVDRLVTVQINQQQFDALVSFCFNLGAGALEGSTLLRLLNDGDFAGAADQFQRWVYAGGTQLPGLAKRRAAEARMFASAPSLGPTIAREVPMGPLVVPALTILADLLPAVFKAFKGESPSKVAERNLDLVQNIANKVIPTVIEATKAVNVEEAIQKIQSQPDIKAAADNAVQAVYYELVEVGGGIEAAREQTRKLLIEGPTWAAAGYGFLMTVLSLTIVGGGGWMLFGLLMDPDASPEQKGMILGAVIASISAVISFYFGSSASSRQSGQAMARIAEGRQQ